jgi:hypothetical protein
MTMKSWRDVLTIHPAAELFPRMSPDELRALGEDIKKNGLHVPVALWAGGGKKMYVIDGVNRLDAMETVGIAFDDMKGFQTMKPETDPYAFAISMNIERRHLNAEQKRDLIAKVIKAKPDTSNNAIAKQVKADDKTVASVRREMEARSEIPNVSTRTDSKGRQQPARKAAKREKATPPPVSEEVLQSPSPVARADIGPDNRSEAERLRIRVDELQAELRLRDIKIAALESEIEELKEQMEAGEASLWDCKLPINRLLDRDMLQRIVDSGLLPLKTRKPEVQAEFERLSPETTKRAAEISEHNAQVLLKILRKHFREVLLDEDHVVDEEEPTPDTGTDDAPPAGIDEAPQPADDGLDIPECLRRTAP